MRFLRVAFWTVFFSISFATHRGTAGDHVAHQQAIERDALVGEESVPDFSAARQLLVVVTDTWNSHRGRLERFAIDEGRWRRTEGDTIPVSLGRKGLAWGRGLLPRGEGGQEKKEGDGRSPAGVFALGTAFGAAPQLPIAAHGYPYLAVDSSDYCVEDTRSDFYNQIIDSNEVKTKVWQQWSALSRADGLFRWGIFVEQNTNPTRVGAGSCIFLHVWRGPGIGTAGCTAMPLEAIQDVISWLRPHDRPLLIQLPRETYGEVAERYGFPSIHERR